MANAKSRGAQCAPVIIENIEIFVNQSEKQIAIHDIDEASAKAAWPAIAAAYPGFTADFCFRDTLAPIAFLKEIGAAEHENCVIMRLLPKDFVDIPACDTGGVQGRVAEIAEFARTTLAADPDAMPEIMVPRDDYLEMGATLHVGFLRAGYFISYRVQNI